MSKFVGVHFMSKSDNWSTPTHVYNKLDDEFGFDFDPCPLIADPSEIVDGLEMEWGRVNFCNPPYSQIASWVEKCFEQWQKGRMVVLLIPSRTDTRWWHDYIMQATEIRFIKGRLKFGASTESAPFPSAVVVFGEVRSQPIVSSVSYKAVFSD